MIALAGIVLALAALWLVAAPLLLGEGAPLEDGPDRLAELRELRSLRDVTYEALRDLEFDRHAGKIADSDYRDLRSRFTDEAVRLVGRIEAIEAAPAPTGGDAGSDDADAPGGPSRRRPR